MFTEIAFFLKRIRYFYYWILNFTYFKYKGITIKNSYTILGRLYIKNKGDVTIDSSFVANSGVSFNPIGGDSILRIIVKTNATLNIGKNVGISNSTIFCTKSITIGNNVIIGGSCRIWDTNFHSTDTYNRVYGGDTDVVSKPITIEDNVFIGGGSIILKGVKIGKNSIVGAGSVVTKTIPENEIWGGNPAKLIGKIS